MSFLEFATDNPITTVVIVTIVCNAVVEVVRAVAVTVAQKTSEND